MAEFLGSPPEIRRVLLDRIKQRTELKLAVAFVSSEWLRLLTEFKGTGRLICWLTSGATDPEAVKQLMQATDGRSFHVRHRHAMHAKVYLSPGSGGFAVVGSANLSSSALAGNDHAGQVEAGVLLQRPEDVAAIDAWFEEQWQEAKEVRPADLERARRAREIAERARLELGQEDQPANPVGLPPGWQPNDRLNVLADAVRVMRLRPLIPSLAHLEPATLDRADLSHIADLLVNWARYEYIFRPLEEENIADAREAFTVAFDEAILVEDRMRRLQRENKLQGLAIPAWSMILHYWQPLRYTPFNDRTRQFIRAYNLGEPSNNLTPREYSNWLDLCAALAVRLDLPSLGHVDRLVWHHSVGLNQPSRQ